MCIFVSSQEKIRGFNEKMKKGQDLNAIIQRRKDFRNPRYPLAVLLTVHLVIELGVARNLGTGCGPTSGSNNW